MHAVHSIGRPTERRSTRLGVRPLRRRRLGRQNVATRHLDPRRRRHDSSGNSATRTMTPVGQEGLGNVTGVNVLVRGVTPGEPAHTTNRNGGQG
jgi:hypothetical protein